MSLSVNGRLHEEAPDESIGFTCMSSLLTSLNSPEEGMAVGFFFFFLLVSAMISLRTALGYRLNLQLSQLRSLTTNRDRYSPIVKRPDGVIDLVTFDLAPMTFECCPKGVWHWGCLVNR